LFELLDVFGVSIVMVEVDGHDDTAVEHAESSCDGSSHGS